MYIPSSFEETDCDTLHDFIEEHSFATLFSQSEAGSMASHLPLLIDKYSGPSGTLIGHFAKANPQWKQADGKQVLVTFHGPHAYVSPEWLPAKNVVPTWNYVAVHASGTLKLQTDPDQLLSIVKRYVEHYETTRQHPWSLDEPDADFVEILLDAIVGFEIEIEHLEGKWKLSQNHDEGRREAVIAGLRESGGSNQLRVADLMAATLEGAAE